MSSENPVVDEEKKDEDEGETLTDSVQNRVLKKMFGGEEEGMPGASRR